MTIKRKNWKRFLYGVGIRKEGQLLAIISLKYKLTI